MKTKSNSFAKLFGTNSIGKTPLRHKDRTELQRLQKELGINDDVFALIERDETKKFLAEQIEKSPKLEVATLQLAERPKENAHSAGKRSHWLKSTQVKIGLAIAIGVGAIVPMISELYRFSVLSGEPVVEKWQPISNLPITNVQDQIWLLQAKVLEDRKDLKGAISTAFKISPNSAYFALAQKRAESALTKHLKWIDDQYKKATDKSFKDVLKAVNIAPVNISKDNPIAKRIQNKEIEINSEWKNNTTYYANTNNLLKDRKLSEAENELKKIKILGKEVKLDSFYWQEKILRIQNEIAYQRSLTQPTPPLPVEDPESEPGGNGGSVNGSGSGGSPSPGFKKDGKPGQGGVQ